MVRPRGRRGTSGPDQRIRFASRAGFWHLGVHRDEPTGQQHGAVNLGQGFPDFPGPAFVKEAGKAGVDADLNQYAVSHGAPRLRDAIARTWNERYGMLLDPEREITVTSGATEAIFDAMQALVAPGDEIVVFEPFYDSYLPSAIMAGASLRLVTLQPPHWTFDPQEAGCRIWAAHADAPAQHTP